MFCHCGVAFQVGVSKSGIGGTRYGAIAYASKAIVVFQLTGSTVEEVLQSLDSIEDSVRRENLGMFILLFKVLISC